MIRTDILELENRRKEISKQLGELANKVYPHQDGYSKKMLKNITNYKMRKMIYTIDWINLTNK